MQQKLLKVYICQRSARDHKDASNMFQQQNMRKETGGILSEKTAFQHCGRGCIGCTGRWSHDAQQEEKTERNAAFGICPVTCKGFPSVAVCFPSLAMCVRMDAVHSVCSSATSRVVLPVKSALHLQLVQPGGKEKQLFKQKSFHFWQNWSLKHQLINDI